MANTFTGFKLQGDLGKFGKTEISDIEGYAELPDGKVIDRYFMSKIIHPKCHSYLIKYFFVKIKGSIRSRMG
jgi:hypothetical protein